MASNGQTADMAPNRYTEVHLRSGTVIAVHMEAEDIRARMLEVRMFNHAFVSLPAYSHSAGGPRTLMVRETAIDVIGATREMDPSPTMAAAQELAGLVVGGAE